MTKKNTISTPAGSSDDKPARKAKAASAKKDETTAIQSAGAKSSVKNKTITAKKTTSLKKSEEEQHTGNEAKAVDVYSRFTDYDIRLFKSGKHYKLYEKFGSHVVEHNGVTGTYFAVWVPNAQYVAVIGNFNGWDRSTKPLYPRWDASGIWEGFIPDIGVGETYKLPCAGKNGF